MAIRNGSGNEAPRATPTPERVDAAKPPAILVSGGPVTAGAAPTVPASLEDTQEDAARCRRLRGWLATARCRLSAGVYSAFKLQLRRLQTAAQACRSTEAPHDGAQEPPGGPGEAPGHVSEQQRRQAALLSILEILQNLWNLLCCAEFAEHDTSTGLTSIKEDLASSDRLVWLANFADCLPVALRQFWVDLSPAEDQAFFAGLVISGDAVKATTLAGQAAASPPRDTLPALVAKSGVSGGDTSCSSTIVAESGLEASAAEVAISVGVGDSAVSSTSTLVVGSGPEACVANAAAVEASEILAHAHVVGAPETPGVASAEDDSSVCTTIRDADTASSPSKKRRRQESPSCAVEQRTPVHEGLGMQAESPQAEGANLKLIAPVVDGSVDEIIATPLEHPHPKLPLCIVCRQHAVGPKVSAVCGHFGCGECWERCLARVRQCPACQKKTRPANLVRVRDWY